MLELSEFFRSIIARVLILQYYNHICDRDSPLRHRGEMGKQLQSDSILLNVMQPNVVHIIMGIAISGKLWTGPCMGVHPQSYELCKQNAVIVTWKDT